jgi:hypothetical protein
MPAVNIPEIRGLRDAITANTGQAVEVLIHKDLNGELVNSHVGNMIDGIISSVFKREGIDYDSRIRDLMLFDWGSRNRETRFIRWF